MINLISTTSIDAQNDSLSRHVAFICVWKRWTRCPEVKRARLSNVPPSCPNCAGPAAMPARARFGEVAHTALWWVHYHKKHKLEPERCTVLRAAVKCGTTVCLFATATWHNKGLDCSGCKKKLYGSSWILRWTLCFLCAGTFSSGASFCSN